MSAFHFDASSRIQTAMLPEDFADWLMDNGRDEEAKDVLTRVEQMERTYEEVDIEDVIDVLEEYGRVIEINKDIGHIPDDYYWETYSIVRELENQDDLWSDDEVLTWDREAQVVNQAIADMGPVTPVDMDEHEYPVTVYVRRGTPILEILRRSFMALARGGYRDGVRDMAQTLAAFTRVERTDTELFGLAWSYVDIVPDD